MNFKKRVNGSWVDIPNYIHKTSTDKFATFPVDIHSTGTTATVGLKGNTVQSGTPTPDSPIQPQECGERTAQIIKYPYNGKSGDMNGVQWTVSNNGHIKGIGTTDRGTKFVLNRNVFFKAGTYTIKIYGKHEGMTLRIYDSVNLIIIASIPPSSRDAYTTFTLNADISNGCEVYFNISLAGVSVDIDCDIMLNTGSTALPYEPYGYKIPISSANVTTPIYLGEVETTRKIKKLVLTGEENWRLNPTPPDSHSVMNTILYDVLSGISPICTHYTGSIDYQWASLPENHITTSIKSGNYIRLAVNVGTESLDDFKAYLAAQYAAGTPVTVWYVLAEPETAVVNEPLMCIGNYADEVSNISIPVTAGGDTISVNTTVQPSEITVTWAGWHNTDIKEYYTDKTISDLEDMTISQMQTYTIASLQGGNWI